MDLNTTNSIFLDFCGGELFWDPITIDTETPQFSLCFLNTIMSWIPCGFLWISSPFFVLYINKKIRKNPLPLSAVNVMKGVTSFVLSCFTVLLLILQEHNGPSCKADSVISTAGYVASVLKFASFWLSIVLQQFQRMKGVMTSAIPFVFWFLILLTEGLATYSHASKQVHCAEDTVFFVYFACIALQLVLHTFAESYRPQGYETLEEKKPWAEEDASVLNRTLYHWFTGVVWKVHKKRFVPEQFWSPSPRLQCDTLAPLLEESWKAELDKCNRNRINGAENVRHFLSTSITYKAKNEKTYFTEKSPILSSQPSRQDRERRVKPNLFLALVRVFWWDWTEATVYRTIAEVLWLLEPIALRYIITIAEDKSSAPEWQGYFFCCMLFVNLCISSCFYHMSYHHMQAVGLKVKTALMCLIYKKALTMKRSGTKASTVGEIVNLMSVDCQRIQDSLTFSMYAFVTLFTFGIALAQLWTLMGIASVGGIGVIVLMLPLVGYLATVQFKLQKEMLYLKGRRIKILNEVISGIKVLKMYAWELSFMKKIQNIRNQELDRLLHYAKLTTITVVFAIHSPFMILFTLVLIHVLTSSTHTLRAEETFTAISIINIIKFPMTICPFLVNGSVQATVSIRRITEFLCQDDLEQKSVLTTKKSASKHVVSIKDGTFTWDKASPFATLNGLDLDINKGQLVAVVGPVGSGKSSLLAACMEEMETVAGDVSLHGSVAYVPQEAWIQNMTLRDNILFGRDYHESKYRKVIEACALLPDLQILAGGDMTEIGEKGINISGGQKQRVNLARSVYNNADIYFLDDPLSAVDSHVGKHLFQKVIGKEGLLKNKTRILVTHGIHWLPLVDRVIVMKGGVVSESGTYSDLINADGAFAEFIANYLQECDDDDDEDPEILQLRHQMQAEIELRSDGGITSEDESRSQSGHRRLKKSVKLSFQRSGKSVNKRTSTEVKKTEGEDPTRLTGDETSEEGSIKPTVLLHFMRAMGLPAVITVIVTMSVFQGLNVYSNFWLTFWTENTVLLNTSLAGTQEYDDTFLFYLLGFAIQGVLQGILVYISFYLALTRMVRASGKLHNSMLKSILHSPMSFFDTTPIGRIMNRFSSDVDIMDNKLPDSFRLWQTMIFSTIAIVAVVTISTPIFIAALLPIIVLYVFFVRFYLPTARQMRRTESVKRSPIYNHFSETITGASVIRAYRCSERFIRESRQRIDENIKFYYAASTGARWVGWRLELMGNFVAFLAALFALLSYDLNGAQVGMSITYAVQLTITLNFGVFAISEMEMNIISAERVTEYTTLPAEADWETDSNRRNTPLWPKFGRIEFRGYKTRYRPGLELVLHGIHCTIREGEKVGIVGRTGAGKSSLALALFRLIESAEGAIVIDGVDISTLGLHELRQKLTILPQDPVLFSGSLRNNLDPFDHYDEESIWFSLECAHLKDFVTNQDKMLDFECGESGQNLSIGQRQLVCLARTLLHKTKVLILDEATAAVDMETDDLIQETTRKQFNDCTILAVAHRLSTVLEYDRLMVLDRGKLAEFDSPAALMENTDGIFYGMAKDAGLV